MGRLRHTSGRRGDAEKAVLCPHRCRRCELFALRPSGRTGEPAGSGAFRCLRSTRVGPPKGRREKGGGKGPSEEQKRKSLTSSGRGGGWFPWGFGPSPSSNLRRGRRFPKEHCSRSAKGKSQEVPRESGESGWAEAPRAEGPKVFPFGPPNVVPKWGVSPSDRGPANPVEAGGMGVEGIHPRRNEGDRGLLSAPPGSPGRTAEERPSAARQWEGAVFKGKR